MRLFAFVAVVLTATVCAGPTLPTYGDQLKCTGYCKGGNKLSYAVGSTYVYTYTADTVTSVSGAGDEQSALHLSADVELHPVSPCDFTLQLHNVNLSDSSSGELALLSEFSSALERNALLFSFQDGRVDELCATSTDLPWVLNIKRGVLSAFQNSMEDLHTGHKLFETDVTGDCETEYTVRSTSEEFSIVDKRKNLLACTHRMDHFLSVQSTPYISDLPARSLPLVKSDHHCVQTFEKGLLTQAVCKESHLFRPFSNGNNGAVTRVVQNLEYVRRVADSPPTRTVGERSRTTLLFQHTADVENMEARAQTIVSSLGDLQRMTRSGVEGDVPKVFSQLVTTLRATTYPTLAKVFSHTRQQNTRKFLLDAMPLVGTADGLTIMVDLYKSGEVTDAEMDSWMTSLTFLKRPTVTMLLAVSILLDGEPRPKAVLGLSALAHSYCQTDPDCHEKEPVQDYLAKLERLLGDGCHVKGRKDMELKILALKGIGNMGILPRSLTTIANCYMNPENPLEVRLAAIGAHRRLPCTGKWTPDLLQTYTNMKVDTEIRIAAYLAVMQCPSAIVLTKLKETLYSEEVNQVASFVWTHLTNIQETSNRWKQSIKNLITSDFLQNKFQTDARKFSRNYEGSMFLDSLNAGVTVDSNIIFTPQSYLPRSASLNLTLDVFGESVNVFEIGSRAEGFELVMEDMFGPGGYFPDKSFKKVLQTARGKHANDELENSIDQLGRIFNKNSKLNTEPQASMYARVFGNEIHYSRYQGLEELMNGQFHSSNPLSAFSKMLSGQDIDYINSFVFLDASYRFPTAVGLALELSVNGSATVGLKASGQVHLSTSPMRVEGKIAPSAAMRVVGTMAVDGLITKAGLQSVNSLHTNTYLEGHASVQGRSLVDIKLNVPRDKVEILEVTSKMFVLRQEGSKEVDGISEDKEASSGCSAETVGTITGMKLCTEVIYPNASRNNLAPYFPLTGPTTLRINLIKTDTFDSYELKFQQLSQADGDVRTMKFQFDTPNSRINRKILTSFIVDQKNTAVKGNLETPFLRLDARGKLEYSENSKALDLSLNMNDKNLFSTRAVVKTSDNGHLKRYEPTLSVIVHNVVDMRLTGKVNYIEDTKYSADFEMAGLTSTPLIFSADLNCGDNKYDMVGSVQSPVVEGTIHANLRQSNSYVNTKVTVDYSVRQAKTESVNLFFKVQSGYKKSTQKNSVYGSLQMSALPEYNLLLHWDRMTSDNYAEYNGRFGLGQTEWHTKQMYRFHARGRDDIHFALLSHLACPSKSVDYKAAIEYKITEFSISTHVLAQLNPQHKFYSALDFQCVDERQELSVEFSTPWRIATVKGGTLEKEPGHFTSRLEGRYEVMGAEDVSRVQTLTVQSTYVDASTDSRQDLKLAVNVSGLWTAAVAGEFVSEVDSSNGWARLDLLDNKYRTNVTYVMNSEGQHTVDTTLLLVDRTYQSQVILLLTDKKTEFSIDLNLSKHLFLSTKTLDEGIIQGVEFELLWDKDVDPSRRISLVAHANNIKREVLLEFPGQYIKAELITLPKRVSGLLEWAEDQKIAVNMEWNIARDGVNGTARLTTPFPGLRSQGFSLDYKHNTTITQIQTEVSWQDDRITLNAAGIQEKSALQVGDKSVAGTQYKVEAEVTSTIKHVHGLTAKYEHLYSVHSHLKSLSVLSSKKTVFSSSWMLSPSELKADLYFESPCKFIPSIHGNVSSLNSIAQGSNHSLQLSVGLDKRVVVKFDTRRTGASGLVQVLTPFTDFKNTSFHIVYHNSGPDLNLDIGMEHNKKLTSLSVSGSRTATLIVGSGILMTPYTDTFEAGFTHSLERGGLLEGISVALGGKQMLLGSVVGTYHSWRDFKLSTDITLPPHSLITKVENQWGGAGVKTELEAFWNGDRLKSSLVIGLHEMHLIALASKLQPAKEVRFELSHKRELDVHVTSLKLHNYLTLSHELTLDNGANWESVVYMKASSSDARITNKQTSSSGYLDFSHSMHVEWNGTVTTANVAYSLHGNGLVKSAEGTLTTPWSHPVVFVFNLPITTTTIKPTMKLQYQMNKEISVASLIQCESQASRFQLDIMSPQYKPIIINAFYDVSLPTKAALLSVHWEENKVDFKSTVHLENKRGSGIVLLTRSDVNGEYINTQFSYDMTRREDITGYLTVGYKDKTMRGTISGSLLNQVWKGGCEVTTPFPSWEKLTTSFSVDVTKPEKMFTVTVGRNEESASLSSTVKLSSPWMLNTELTSTTPSLPNLSMSALLEVSQVRRSLQLLFNNGGQQGKAVASLHTSSDTGVIEVSVRSPFAGIEDLLGRASYVGKPGNSTLGVVLRKNEWKVQIDANSLWKENSTGEASLVFLSPFEGLEKMTVLLTHKLKAEPDKQILTNVVMTRNDERVEMSSSIAASLDALIVNVQCMTPFNEYKIVVGDLAIKWAQVEKSIQLSLAKNSDYVVASGVFKRMGEWNAEGTFQLATPFKGYEELLAGFEYDWHSSLTHDKSARAVDGQAKLFLKVLDIVNECEVVLNFSPSLYKTNINAALKLPTLSISNINVEGMLDIQQQVLTLQGKVDNQFLSLYGELHENSLDTSILSSINGFEKLNFSSVLTLTPEKKVAKVLLAKNNDEIVVTSSISVNRLTSELLVTGKTPIKQWEGFSVNAKFDVSKEKKNAMVSFERVDDQYSITAEWSGQGQKADYSVLLSSPVPGFKFVRVSAEYGITQAFSAKALLQTDKHKVEGVVLVTDKDLRVSLATPLEQVRYFALIGNYDLDSKLKSVTLQVERNEDKYKFNMKLLTTSDTSEVLISTPFKYWRELSILITHRGVLTDKSKVLGLSVYKEFSNLVEISGEIDLQWESRVGFNLNVSMPVLSSERLSTEAWYTVQLPQRNIVFHLYRNSVSLAELEVGITLNQEDGLEYLVKVVGGLLDYERHALEFELHSKQSSVQSVFTLINYGTEDKYSVRLLFSNTTLELGLSSPVEGYEDFSLHFSNNEEHLTVDFNTSFFYYDTLKLTADISNQSKHDNSLSFSMAKNKEIYELEWKLQYDSLDAKSSFYLASPFTNYRSFLLKGAYDLRNEAKTAMLALDRNEHSVKIDCGLALKSWLSGESSINVTTSFTDLRNMRLYGNLDMDRPSHKNVIFFAYFNDARQVGINFDLETGPNKVKVAVVSVTPYYETSFIAKGGYDFSDPTNLVSVEGLVSVLDVIVNMSAVIEEDSKRGEIYGRFSKDKSLHEGKFLWNVENGPRRKSARVMVDFGDRKKAEVSASVNVDRSITRMVARLTDFHSHLYAVTADWNIVDGQFNTQLGVQWNQKRMVLDGTFKGTNSEFSVDLKLTSPIKNLEEIVIQSTWSYGSTRKFTTFLKWKDDKSIVLNVLYPTSRVQVRLETPFTSPFLFILSHLSTKSASDLRTEVHTSLYYGSWKNDMNVTLNVGKDFHFGLTLATPIYDLQFLKIDSSLKSKDIKSEVLLSLLSKDETWQLSGSVERDDVKCDVDVKLTTPGQHGEVVASYDLRDGYAGLLSVSHDNEMLVNGSVKLVPSHVVFEVRTPWQGLQVVSVEGRVEALKHRSQLVATAIVEDKKSEIMASINEESDKKITAEFDLKTPWTKDFSLKSLYSSDDNHAVKATLRMGDSVTEMLGTGSYKVEGLRMEVEVECMIEGRESVSAKAGYNWQSPQKNVHLSVRMGEAMLHVRAQGKVSREGITGDIHLDTPMDSLKLFELQVRLEKTGSVEMNLNDNKYKLQYSTVFSVDSIGGQASIVSPKYKLRNAEFNIEYGRNVFNFNGEIDGEKIEFLNSYHFENSKTSFSSKLLTPVNSPTPIELKYDLDLKTSVFSSLIQWGVTDKINIESKLDANDFHVIITTPFDNIHNMELSSQIVTRSNQYITQAKVDWDGLKVVYDGNIHIEPLDVNLNFQAELRDSQIATLRTAFTNEKEKINMHIFGTVQDKKVDIVGEIDKVNLAAKLHIETPFLDKVPMYAEAQITKDLWKTCEVDIRMSLPNISYKLTASYALTDTDLKVGLDMDMPFIHSSLVFGGSYSNNNFTDMETVMFINDNRISVSYEISNKVLTCSVDVNIPDLGISVKRVDAQTSLGFSPDAQVSLTFRSSTYNGSLAGSLTKSSSGFSLRTDVDLPQTLGPLTHTARVGLKYRGPQRFLEVRLDDGRSTRSSSLEVTTSGSDISVVGQVSGPSVGEKEVTVMLVNKWRVVAINFFNVLRFEFKNDISSGSVSVSYDGKDHKLLYHMSRDKKGFDTGLELQSVLLKGGDIDLGISSEVKDKNIRAALRCSVGSSLNEAVVHFVNEQTKKSLVVNVIKGSETIARFDITKQMKGSLIENEASLEWSKSVHAVSFRYSPSWPINVLFSISSPHVPENVMKFEFKLDNISLMAFAGIGNEALNQYASLKGGLNIDERTVNFEFLAPFYDVKKVSFNGMFKLSKQNIHLSVDGLYSTKTALDIELTSKFIVSKEGIDSLVNIQTPFARLRHFTAVVQIPFKFSKQYDVKLLLSLPSDAKYEVYGQMHKLVDTFKLSAGLEYNAQKIAGALKVLKNPVFSVDFKLDTPYKSLKHYQVQLRGQRSLVDGDDIVNYVEWGDQRIELRHSTVSTGSKFDYSVQLMTPFKGYDRYVAALQFQFDDNKKAVALLSLPGMKDDWTIEFDFRLKDIFDSSLLVNVQVPIFTGFQSASLLVGSKYDMATVSYRSVISGNYNQHEFVTTLGSVIEGKGLKVDFNTQLDKDKINAQFVGGMQDSGAIIGTFELESPFSQMRNGKVSLKMLDYSLTNIQINVNVNSVDIVDVSVYETEEKKKIIEIRNMWRPVSVAYSLYFGKDIGVCGEVCWDLNNKTASQFGAGVRVTNGPQDRIDISLNLKLPSREMSLSHVRHESQSVFEHSTMFSWESKTLLGYRVLVDVRSKPTTMLRLDLPFRAFEVSTFPDFFHGTFGAQFLWNAALDRSKKMGMSLAFQSQGVELSLQHSAMKHDVSLRLEQENFLTPHPGLPTTLKFILQYSPLPQDLFTIGIFYKIATIEQRGMETFVSAHHDASKLDHSILLSILHTGEISTAGLVVNYKKSLTGEKRSLEIYGKLRRSNPDIEVFIKDTNNKLLVKGSVWTKDNGSRGFTAQLAMNQKEPLRIEGQLNRQEMSSELDIGYGASRGYTLSAGMPTPRLIFAGVMHKLHGLPSTDGQLTLKLNTSRLLWTQARWQPGMLAKMRVSLFREYTDVSLVAQSIVGSFSEVFEEEPAIQLLSVFSTIYTHSFADIGTYTEKEIQLVTYDFADTVEAVASMYEKNDFYIKDIYKSLAQTISSIQQKGAGILKQLLQLIQVSYSNVAKFFSFLSKTFTVEFTQIKKFFNEIQEILITAYEHMTIVLLDLQELSKSLRGTARNMLRALHEGIAETEKTAKRLLVATEAYMVGMVKECSRSFHPLAVTVQHYAVILHHSMLAIEHSIMEMTLTIVDTIMSIKELNELVDLYNEYAGWLEGFQVQDYIDSVFQYLNVVGEMMIEDFNRMFAEYKASITAALNVVSNQVELMDRTPAVIYMKHAVSTVYEKASWAWSYLDMSTRIESYARGVLSNLDEIVEQLLHSVDMGPRPRYRSHQRQLVVRPGFLELSQHLPVDWESFQQWPEFSQLTAPSATHDAGDNSYQNLILATLKKLTPNFSKATLLPPFGATGLVAGKQHFITFDNYFYDFVGECSYLLASDFLNNKFSVVVNYEFMNNKAVKKTLTVISDQQEIEISANYQVSVNGKKTELPAIVGDGIVLSRFGNRLIVEIESYMTFECNLVHDICTVQLTGWNFGRTGGLLGTFDNEPSNDISLANRTSTSDLARFASSWRVGNTSRCQPMVNHANTPPVNDDAVDACDAYLADVDSPLADCYSSVDPMPYYHMCISDMARSDNAAGVCTAAVAYATVCRKSGIEVSLPQECVQCHLSNSPALSVGESKVLNAGIPMSADVVFVVEQASCIKGVNLTKMATKLDAALVQQGLKNNRFSLVGFGGDTFSEPHSRTAKGEIWTSGRNLEKALAGLVLSDRDVLRDEQNVYNALAFASGLSYRGGVSKTVVLVQCSACGGELDYGDMMGLLLRDDMTLHLLQPGAIALRGGSAKANGKVFGADLSGVYTARNGKNAKPNTDMLKQMILPKDHCSPLAFETNGTVFNLERVFGSAKQSVSSKRFADLWSRRVAQAARPSPCQKCECVAGEDGVGQVKCSTCVTASVDQYLLDWQSLVIEDHGQRGSVTSAMIEEEDA